MMEKLKKYKLISAMAVMTGALLFSCTEEIQLDLNNSTSRLVVDGVVTTDTTRHYVRLSLSGPYYENQSAEAVSDARVTIDDGHREVVLVESQVHPGYYLTPQDYFGVVGRIYHLRVSGVDINNDGTDEVYEAESGLMPVAPVDSIRLEYNDVWEVWKVLLYAQDPPETKDFYSFAVYLNNELLSNRYSELGYVEDKFFDGNYASGVWAHTIDEEEEEIELMDGDWIKLKMAGITEDFYLFLDAVETETGFKSPLFSGVPANVPSNVSNGALGFFTAYSYSMDSVQFVRP